MSPDRRPKSRPATTRGAPFRVGPSSDDVHAKGDMKGWFEVRVDGPQRRHYRLFCRLDYEAKGQSRALLVVIDGRAKAFRTELSAADYQAVRALGDEYLAGNPRSIA